MTILIIDARIITTEVESAIGQCSICGSLHITIHTLAMDIRSSKAIFLREMVSHSVLCTTHYRFVFHVSTSVLAIQKSIYYTTCWQGTHIVVSMEEMSAPRAI